MDVELDLAQWAPKVAKKDMAPSGSSKVANNLRRLPKNKVFGNLHGIFGNINNLVCVLCVFFAEGAKVSKYARARLTPPQGSPITQMGLFTFHD